MPNFLILLFFTEMWERFSYYGMRSLLVLFLTSQLGFSDPKAYAIYSLFAAIGYAGPVIGGILADKWLGFRNMVLIGAIILTAGHFIMAFIQTHPALLYIGLGLIAVGAGLFKGNITNLLGCCYDDDDPRRDSGFTIFYVSINVGSVLASVSCGLVAYKFGWHFGFGLAGIGMLCGLLTFLKFQHILGDKGYKSVSSAFRNKILLAGFLAGLVAALMLFYSYHFAQLLAVFGVGIALYLIHYISTLPKKEKKNMITLMILMIFFLLFFGLEMQLGSLFNLFTERNVQKQVLGIFIPTPISQAINPFSIIVLGPLVSILFARMGHRWAIHRFGLGLLTMVLCFLCLYIGCLHADETGMVGYGYLFFGICLMGLGELCIAPLIQNLFTLLSPPSKRGFLMGVLMLSLAFSNLSGNIVAKFMSVPTTGIEQLGGLASLAIYQRGFLEIIVFNVGICVIFLLLLPVLHKTLRKNLI